jgi:signal transduction histidine kinase
VVRGIITKGAFYWLRAPRSCADLHKEEWILAIIRLLLGFCYLGAFFHPDRIHYLQTYEIIALAYIGYGVLIIIALARNLNLSPYCHICIHCLDLLWASQLTGLTHWPTVAYAMLFFIMVSTAFRWGFWETPLTFVIFHALAYLGYSLYNSQSVLALPFIGRSNIWMEDLLYVAMIVAVALLAEAKAARSENDASARILAQVRTQSGLEQTLRIATDEGIQVYGAAQILLVMRDINRNRVLLFRNSGLSKANTMTDMDVAHAKPYLFLESGVAIRLDAARGPGRYRCMALSQGKIGNLMFNDCLPKAFMEAHPFRLLLATSVTLQHGWTVNVYVLDPKRFFGGRAGLRFLHNAANRLAPVVHDAFMVDRVTTRAKAAAGGQLARELHDGIIQSLSLINMKLEDLQGKFSTDMASQVDPLKQIRHSLQEEIAELRDFTQQLRALELDSNNLLSYIAGMTVKFQAEHGIATRFVSEGIEEVQLTPRKCVELARITQEALVNIRKHSNAQEALVMLYRRNGHYVLSVLDNGRGFRFFGHRSHDELQASGEGPIVIMDRAKAIGGTVSVESIENSGSRVEVLVPIT